MYECGRNTRRIWALMTVLLLLAASLLGCGARVRTPEETADLLLTYLRDGKTKKAETLMYDPNAFSLDAQNGIELNDALARHLRWQLGQKRYDAENNYYMLEAQITMADVSAVMGTLTTKYFDQMLTDASNGVTWENDTLEKSLLLDLNEAITSDNVPVVTKNILIYLVPDEKQGWLVFVQDDLINAVTGGVLELFEFYTMQ